MKTRIKSTRVRVASVGLVFVLGACAETQLGAQLIKSAARSSDPVAQPAAAVSADPTLAPEAFDATGLTIWDGAATLQGVWFAHPLAQRAQRVRVTNLQNGLVTEGALFKRDPALSGPSILVSSDAARSLGLTPGAATELQIIALREGPIRRTAEVPVVAPQTLPQVETAALAPPEPAAATTAAPAAAGVAADAASPATDAAAPSIPATSEANDIAAAPPPATADNITDNAPVPEPLDTAAVADGGGAVPETGPPADPTPQTTPEPLPDPAPLPDTEQDITPAPAPDISATQTAATPAAASPSVAPVEQTELAAADASVAADPNSPDEALPELLPANGDEIALADTQVVPPAPSARPAKPAPLPVPDLADIGPSDGNLQRGDYLQVGSFSIEPNAAILVQNLIRRGQPGRYVNRTINGRPFSIVIIGPLGDDAGVTAAKAAARAEGLNDTIKVKL